MGKSDVVDVGAFGIRCELIPNCFSWVAIESGPEEQNGVKNNTRDDSPPGTVEHRSVGTPTGSKETKVLDQDGHLDEETQWTIDKLSYVRPLCALDSGVIDRGWWVLHRAGEIVDHS